MITLLKTNFKKLAEDAQNSKIIYYVFILFFLYFAYYDSFEVTIPLLFSKLEIDIIYFGVIISISKVIRSVIVIPISRLKENRKFILLISIIFFDAFLMMCLPYVENTYIISGFFIVFLSTTSIFNVVLNPKLGSIVDKEKIGIAFGIRDVFLYGGSFAGLILTGIISKRFSIIFIFLVYSIIFMAIGLLLILIRKDLKSGNLVINNDENETIEVIEEKDKNEDNMKGLIKFLITNVILTFGMTWIPYAPLYAKKIGIDNLHIYYIFSTSILFSAVFSLLGGLIIDKNNKKKLLTVDALVSVMIIVFFLMNMKYTIIIGILLIGVGALFDNAVNGYLFNNFDNTFIDKNWGIISATNLISASISVAAYSYMYDNYSQYLFYIALLFTIIGVILTTLLDNTERMDSIDK